MVKDDKALWMNARKQGQTCLSQTHFLTSCLNKCFSVEITVSMESDFIELEGKINGKKGDEKTFKEG